MLDAGTNRKKWLIAAGICVLTVLVYWQIGADAFVTYDDATYVTGNPHVRSGLSWSNLAWAVTATQAANWHPLTWLSHMLDCQFYGVNAGGHHLTSLLLHVVNAVLLFWVLHYMTSGLWTSAFAATLFAIHPLNVESVAWIAERKNVLSTLFWILTLWAYAWYARSPGWRRYLLASGAFALGLMSKPMLVTLPFVLLLLDYWPLQRFGSLGTPPKPEATTTRRPRKSGRTPAEPAFTRRSGRALILEKVPLLVLAAASSIVTVIAQRQGKAVGSLETYSMTVRVENAVVSYAHYLVQTFWPSGLCVFYPHPQSLLPVWEVTLAALLLVGVTVISISQVKHLPFLAVGWFWYLGTLVPVIGLVQVGLQSRADRYMYVPLIGVFIVIAWSLHELLTRLPSANTTIIAAASAAVVVLALIAHIQTGYWQDSVSLFTRAVAVTQNNYVAENNLGEALGLQGKTVEAEKHFAAAVAVSPDYSLALNNLAMSRVQAGNLDDAISLFSRAVANDPTFYEAYNRLGATLLQKDRLDEASESIRKALELNPTFASAYGNLGTLLEKQNRVDDALDAYTNAVRFSQVASFSAQMHYRIGLLLEKAGKDQDALSHYQEAIRLKPDHSQAQQSLNSLAERMKGP